MNKIGRVFGLTCFYIGMIVGGWYQLTAFGFIEGRGIVLRGLQAEIEKRKS